MDTSPAGLPADPRSMLITDELDRRPPRAVDLSAEVEAMHRLTGIVAANPQDTINRFLDITMTICDAGSAGLSLLADGPDGSRVFQWDAIRGEFADYTGGSTPADFSPCGLCLEAGRTILIERPERIFTYFASASPAIVEGLIVPLYDAGHRAIGTLWIICHDEDCRFDGETARQMEQLAPLLVLAIRMRRDDAKLASMLDKLQRRVSGRPADEPSR